MTPPQPGGSRQWKLHLKPAVIPSVAAAASSHWQGLREDAERKQQCLFFLHSPAGCLSFLIDSGKNKSVGICGAS